MDTRAAAKNVTEEKEDKAEKAEKEKTEKKEKPAKKAKAEKKESEESDSDPEPRHPGTCYMLFANSQREDMRKKYPGRSGDDASPSDLKLVELTGKIGEMWKELSDEEKAKYKKESETLREQYEKVLAAWKARK